MKRVIVRKSGWNVYAALAGPFWYLYRGMIMKGLMMLLLSIVTFGVGILPIWIYCGYNANKDFYHHLKNKGIYIFHDEVEADEQ